MHKNIVATRGAAFRWPEVSRDRKGAVAGAYRLAGGTMNLLNVMPGNSYSTMA
jgi:hypothetical protein